MPSKTSQHLHKDWKPLHSFMAVNLLRGRCKRSCFSFKCIQEKQTQGCQLSSAFSTKCEKNQKHSKRCVHQIMNHLQLAAGANKTYAIVRLPPGMVLNHISMSIIDKIEGFQPEWCISSMIYSRNTHSDLISSKCKCLQFCIMQKFRTYTAATDLCERVNNRCNTLSSLPNAQQHSPSIANICMASAPYSF